MASSLLYVEQERQRVGSATVVAEATGGGSRLAFAFGGVALGVASAFGVDGRPPRPAIGLLVTWPLELLGAGGAGLAFELALAPVGLRVELLLTT